MRNVFEGFVLPNPAASANSVLASFEQGRKLGEDVRRDKALRAFSEDPDNPEALNALIAVSPELGFKAADYQRKRQEGRREDEFNGALSRYTMAQRNALTPQRSALSDVLAPGRGEPIGGAPGSAAIPNALAPPTAAQLSVPGTASINAPVPAVPEAPAGPDYSILGEPQDEADEAFLVMLKNDPKRALEIDSKLRDSFLDRVKDEHDAFGYAVAHMAGVNDPSTYQQRRAQIVQRFAPLGMDIAAAIPEQFPGEDGLRDLRLRGLDLKDQLAALLNRDNVEADNERADRNADSLIADREARRGIQTRGQDLRDRTTRRGQDVRADVTRRGQDTRGSGRGGRAGSPRVVSVRTPQEAMKLAPGTVFRTPDGRVKVR